MFTLEQQEKALKNYNLEQEQRFLERMVRKWKRIETGSTDPENVQYAKNQVKKYQKSLREHVKENPNLRRKYWRERTEPMLNLRQDELVKKSIPQSPYEDVTQQWLDNVDHTAIGQVIKNDYFDVNGMRYDSSNAKLDMNFGDDEIKTASWLKDTFHEDVQLVPRTSPIGKPTISTPDFLFKNQKWDLKTPNMNSKNTIRDLIKKSKKKDGTIQATNFVIDISRIDDSQQNIESNINKLFVHSNTKFVDTVMTVKNGKLISIKKKRDETPS